MIPADKVHIKQKLKGGLKIVIPDDESDSLVCIDVDREHGQLRARMGLRGNFSVFWRPMRWVSTYMDAPDVDEPTRLRRKAAAFERAEKGWAAGERTRRILRGEEDKPLSETPTVRDFAQNTDLSQPARQARLDNIPTKEKTMHTTREFGDSYLLKWLFNQDEIWITAAGEEKCVEEMDLDHALNTLLMMERVVEDFPFPRDELQDKPLYKALYARVKDALTGLDVGTPEENAPLPSMWATTPRAIRDVLEAALPVESALSKTASARVRVALDYVDHDGTQSTPVVSPFKISDERMGRVVHPYLVAKNVDKNEMRTYRLDRIKAARLVSN